jgi:hypothetical protein
MKIMCETIANLGNDSQIRLDCSSDQPKTVACGDLGSKRSERPFRLYELQNFLFVINEEVHEHVGEQSVEKRRAYDGHSTITNLLIAVFPPASI